MPDRVRTLVTGTSATTTGQVITWNGQAPSRMVQAYLDADGGTATVVLYGRLSTSSVWATVATFTLSGANDRAEWLIDNEPWAQLRADITAISGTGAQATCEVGY